MKVFYRFTEHVRSVVTTLSAVTASASALSSEVRIIGTEDKNKFSMSEPKNDSQFAKWALDPVIVPIRRDYQYRTVKKTQLPYTKAVVIYMMDVSGSMGEEQKELVRIESFWIDTWLQSQYDGVQVRYIMSRPYLPTL